VYSRRSYTKDVWVSVGQHQQRSLSCVTALHRTAGCGSSEDRFREHGRWTAAWRH
jgi:hypothetical protein